MTVVDRVTQLEARVRSIEETLTAVMALVGPREVLAQLQAARQQRAEEAKRVLAEGQQPAPQPPPGTPAS